MIHIHICKYSPNSTRKIKTNGKKEQRGPGGKETPALKLISEGDLDARRHGVFIRTPDRGGSNSIQTPVMDKRFLSVVTEGGENF